METDPKKGTKQTAGSAPGRSATPREESSTAGAGDERVRATVNPAHPADAPEPQDADRPPRRRGATFIDDDVVSVIARIASEQVPGIHKLGDSSLRSFVSRLGRTHGVDSEVGMKQAAVDIEIEVEFGYPITEVAGDMRERVIETVERMTGRSVVEVNVYVIDVHVPKVEHKHRRQLE
jgi:uncharacterized alkaline shock family protein YloU